MLRLSRSWIFLLFFTTVNSLIYDIHHSVLKEVTVGGNIAEVLRSFSLQDVPSGYHSIVVDHVPNTVDEKSIQVTGLGAAEVVSTIVQNQVILRDNNKEFVALTALLRAVNQRLSADLEAAQLEHTRATKRIAVMEAYIQDAIHTSVAKPTSLTLVQLTETLDYQEKAQGQFNEKVVTLNEKISRAQASLTTLQTMMETLEAYGFYRNLFSSDDNHVLKDLPVEDLQWSTEQVKELHINIHVPASATDPSAMHKLTFNIEYMASPAAWQAEYDVRLERTPPTTTSTTREGKEGEGEGEYKLRIGLYAVVAQSTREDWTNVQLHLSTSQPQQHIYPPSPPTRLALTYQPEVVPQPEHMHYRQAKVMASSGRYADAGSVLISSGSSDSMSGGVSVRGGAAAPEMMQFADMNIATAEMTGQSGNLGAAVRFSPPHPVNITSNHARNVQLSVATTSHVGRAASGALSVPAPRLNSAATQNTRLFIQDTVLKPRVFTYAVPTTGAAQAHLKAWSLANATTRGEATGGKGSSMPLLASSNGRVFLQDTYTGTTTIPATQAGATLRLDLGEDRNIEIKSTFVLPRQGSRSEDKSTWFVTDKVKYKVEVVEYAFTVRSTHDADGPHLVVLSEYLPHVGEEGIKIELLQPANEAILQVDGAGGQQDVWSEEEFVSSVLAHPALVRPDKTHKPSHSDTAMKVFVSKGSNNIVWAAWVNPGLTFRAGLKYRIIWPDGKNIEKQTHN